MNYGLIWESHSLPDLSTSSLPSNPPTPPSRASEALKADLRAVNQQLEEMKEHWEREKRQLLGEKAILQDTAHRLNLQVRSVQDEAKRSAESGKAAQRAKISVQAVSSILARLLMLSGALFLGGVTTGAGHCEAVDCGIGIGARGREIQAAVSPD